MKFCKDCKYVKGIGFDFWCGEGHTKYEVFLGETNCPYYEFHDWSKGIPDSVMDKTKNEKYKLRSFDLDFYQLMKPIANMILWEYGLKLVGDNDNYTLDCFNYKMFRNKLMEELKYSLEEGE